MYLLQSMWLLGAIHVHNGQAEPWWRRINRRFHIGKATRGRPYSDTPTRLDGRINHAKLWTEVQEFLWTKRFGQNIRNHVVCGYIDYVAFFLVHELADEMVSNVNMLDPTIMSRINR